MPSRAWFVGAGAVLLLGLGAAAYPAREAATAVRTPVVLASGQQTLASLDRDGLMIFGSGFTFANCTIAALIVLAAFIRRNRVSA